MLLSNPKLLSIYSLTNFKIFMIIYPRISVSGIKKAVEELNPIRRTVFGMLYN